MQVFFFNLGNDAQTIELSQLLSFFKHTRKTYRQDFGHIDQYQSYLNHESLLHQETSSLMHKWHLAISQRPIDLFVSNLHVVRHTCVHKLAKR